jgi:uncharacterized protein YutD
MDNEEVGKRVRRIYNKFNKMVAEQGYDKITIKEFLEWIEDLIEIEVKRSKAICSAPAGP